MFFDIHWNKLATSTCIPHPEPLSHIPHHLIPLGCLRTLALNSLLHASNLHWSSILHMVIYMFQCFSLKSSHTHLLPQSWKILFLHLCFFFCPAYMIIITIFLKSIHMHSYTAFVFLCFTYFTLYNMLQVHPPH